CSGNNLTTIVGQMGAAGKAGPHGPKGDPDNKGTQGEREILSKFSVGLSDQPQEATYRSVLFPLLTYWAAKNCKELLDQGLVFSDWYMIYPDGKTPLKVLCDMHTDGGGWIVFQRRWDGSVDFFRDWKSYKNGFGSRLNEFWLGNDNIHMLTSAGTWELRIDLKDFENTKQFAKYASFQVLGESEKYKLLLGAFKNGNAVMQRRNRKNNKPLGAITKGMFKHPFEFPSTYLDIGCYPLSLFWIL
ncbi:Hypothetical predicted protein, partial [Pelobates cultripes]